MAYAGFGDKLESNETILWSGADISSIGKEIGNNYALTNLRIHIYTHNSRSSRKEGAGTHYTTVPFNQIGLSREDALQKDAQFFIEQKENQIIFQDIDCIVMWEWTISQASAVYDLILKQIGVVLEAKKTLLSQDESYFEQRAVAQKELDKKTKSLLNGTEKKVYYQERYRGGLKLKVILEFFIELFVVVEMALFSLSAADEITMITILMFDGLLVLLLFMMRWRILLARTYCVITNNAIHIYKKDRDYTSLIFLQLHSDSTVELLGDKVRVTAINSYLDGSKRITGAFGNLMDKLAGRVIEFRCQSDQELNELYDLIQYVINNK